MSPVDADFGGPRAEEGTAAATDQRGGCEVTVIGATTLDAEARVACGGAMRRSNIESAVPGLQRFRRHLRGSRRDLHVRRREAPIFPQGRRRKTCDGCHTDAVRCRPAKQRRHDVVNVAPERGPFPGQRPARRVVRKRAIAPKYAAESRSNASPWPPASATNVLGGGAASYSRRPCANGITSSARACRNSLGSVSRPMRSMEG